MDASTATGPAHKRADVLREWLQDGSWGWVTERDCPVCDASPGVLLFGEHTEPEYQDGYLLNHGGARVNAHAATCGCQLDAGERRKLYEDAEADADADPEVVWRDTRRLKEEARRV